MPAINAIMAGYISHYCIDMWMTWWWREWFGCGYGDDGGYGIWGCYWGLGWISRWCWMWIDGWLRLMWYWWWYGVNGWYVMFDGDAVTTLPSKLSFVRFLLVTTVNRWQRCNWIIIYDHIKCILSSINTTPTTISHQSTSKTTSIFIPIPTTTQIPYAPSSPYPPPNQFHHHHHVIYVSIQ